MYQGVLRDGDQEGIILVSQQQAHQKVDCLACTISQEELRRVSRDAAIAPLDSLLSK